jgi:methylated-DNA-[protein]-cysteine S-methyltransferase
VPLFITSHKTPIGTLNLIAREEVLLAANLSTISAAKASLDEDDCTNGFKEVKSIPVISDLINDYFDGDLSALNAIKVRQPGAPFSQAAWKAMRRVKAGKTLSYAELADRIVKTGGALGNYAYGLNKKEWLLRFEAAL